MADFGYGSEENYEYLAENLPYDSETDSYSCRNGKRLIHAGSRQYVTEAGYETRLLPMRGLWGLNGLKRKANENLCFEKGLELRSQRVVEVKQTFGRIKGCWSFRRFLLRGKDKVKIEGGLLSIVHNITKMALEG